MTTKKRGLGWRRQMILLDCTSGPKSVTASVCQGLAVHPAARPFGNFSITHVSSGRAIQPSGLPRALAFRFARELLKAGNWRRPVEDVMKLERRVPGARTRAGL